MIRQKWEAFWIDMAIRILKGRQVSRSMVVSKRDNDSMWYMGDALEAIAKRIRNGYSDPCN